MIIKRITIFIIWLLLPVLLISAPSENYNIQNTQAIDNFTYIESNFRRYSITLRNN